MDTLFLNEQRCKCGKLLLKGLFFDGTFEIKCKKCGIINKIGSIKLADDETHYLLIINNKGIITNVSNSACVILEYPHEELIGKHYSQISPMLSSDVIEKFFGPESIIDGDNYFQLDTVHKSKNNKNLSITAIMKLYQPTENEKQILLSAELKNSPIEQDLLNKKIIGFAQEVFVGGKFFDIISIENRKESIKIFENLSSDGQPYRTTNISFINPNNKDLVSELYFAPRYNEMGKFVGYSVLVWSKNKI